MAALSTLWVELRASTAQFAADMSQAQKEIRAFDKDVRPITDRLKEFGQAATTAGKALTVAVTAPIAAVAGIGIAFNAMQEQAQIAFTTMLGSGTKAKVFLDDLKNFAAKTPFEFPDLVHATQRLMAMGFSAEQVKPTLIAVGNAVSGLGGGAPEINRVTLALGQMQGRGRVATQEMNQLTEVGIPAWKILADTFGLSEMNLRSMVEKGVVPADKAVAALVAGMNERFPNMMEKQATSFNGLISTIKDEARFLAGDLTAGLFNSLKGPAQAAADSLHMLRDAMTGWSNETKAAIAGTLALAAAIGPILLVVGQLSLGLNQLIILGGHLNVLLGTAGLSVGLIASVAGITALGAAIGIAIGLFVNWLLRITELEAAFDKLVIGIVRNVPIVGQTIANWATGTEGAKKAADGLTSAQQKLVAEFAKHGVVVDQARLGDDKYLASLAALSKQWTDGAQAITKHASATKMHLDITEKSTAAFKKQQEAIFTAQMGLYAYHHELAKVADGLRFIESPIQRGLPDFANIGEIPIQHVGLPPNFGNIPQAGLDRINKQWEDWRKSGQTAIDQVVNDMSRMFVDSITHGKNFWEAFKNVGINAVASIIDTLMTKILHSFLDPFATAIGKLLDGLTSGLSGALTGLGSRLAGAIGLGGGGAAGVATSVAGSAASAGGTAASAAGALANSLSGGLISAAGSIIGGGLAALATLRTEGTLNAIEYNTRATMIHNQVMIDSFFAPWTSIFEWSLNWAHESAMILDAIYNLMVAGGGVGAVPAAGGGVTNNITLNITTAAAAREVLDYIDGILSTGQGGYRERWALWLSQNAGIVSTVPAG